MPGITERQLIKGGTGLRSFQHIIAGHAGDTDYFAAQLTGAGLTGLAAGDLLTLVANGMPIARAVTVKYIAAATVATRSLVLRFRGVNQFFEYVEEDITISATASQTHCVQGTKVFMRVDAIEVVSASSLQTGDTLNVGLDIDVSGTTALDPEDVIYGLPVKCKEASDIQSLMTLRLAAGGGGSAALPGSDATFVPAYHGVKLPASIAPDSGNDRIVVVAGYTTW